MPAPTPRQGTTRIKAHMLGGVPSGQRPPAIRLNSNESAYGASPHALAAARAAVSGIERYIESPEVFMRPAIAAATGLDPDRIAIGHGSDDLISRVARAYLSPGDALMRSANGYLKVPNYAHAADADVISVTDDGLVPSVDRMIAALTARTRIVYLANPENPAGTYVTGRDVRRLHAALPDQTLLVLDCAYEDYVDAADYEPGRALAAEFSNVVATHTFSKVYGLAGARVGWIYGDPEVVDVVRRVGVTFPLTTPSAAAVLAALEDRAHVAMVREENRAQRRILSDRLTDLGLAPVPSQTNFVLVRFDDPKASAEAAAEFLRSCGILVRRFAAPAYADYLRITIGFPHENAACIEAIAAFLDTRR